MRRALTAAVLALFTVAAVLLVLLNRHRPFDPDFDTSVSDPAYRANGPLVLYDEAHRNIHTMEGAYEPFVTLLRNDGYRVHASREPVSLPQLAGVSVLAVVCARGANDANDAPAFSEPESAAIEQWVRSGGSLLLVADHWPFGAAIGPLAERLGVRVSGGMVEDPAHHDERRGDSHLIFAADNGLLKDHAIVRGRSPSERVQRVLTFTGTSMLGPPDSVAFLALSDRAVERPPQAPKVEKHGGDIRVEMVYGDAAPARGNAQGLAMELGQGRIVVLGEAGMLRAQRDHGELPVGMNVPGYDNRQLALNIVHWLSRAI